MSSFQFIIRLIITLLTSVCWFTKINTLSSNVAIFVESYFRN